MHSPQRRSQRPSPTPTIIATGKAKQVRHGDPLRSGFGRGTPCSRLSHRESHGQYVDDGHVAQKTSPTTVMPASTRAMAPRSPQSVHREADHQSAPMPSTHDKSTARVHQDDMRPKIYALMYHGWRRGEADHDSARPSSWQCATSDGTLATGCRANRPQTILAEAQRTSALAKTI